jgi:hypothetical protein
MARIREKGLKPFECEYIDDDSILVNYGTVICPASNSNQNIFVPKGSNGKYLNKILDDNYIGPLPLNNIVDINGALKGSVCLNIIFKDVEDYIKENADEWEKALFQKNSQLCHEYLNQTATKDFLNRITSDGTLANIDLANESLGISDLALLPIFETIDPASEGAEEAIQKNKEALVQEKADFENWNPESSAYYKAVNPDDPYDISSDRVSKPREWIYSTYIMPLVNFSLPISEVLLEFHESEMGQEEEERLDKYNFIIGSSKLVPIAYLDTSQKIIIDQIIDFDYIFNFPFHFNSNLSTKFI